MTIAVSPAFTKHMFVVLLSTLHNFFCRRQMITKVFVFLLRRVVEFYDEQFFFFFNGTTDSSGPGTLHCRGFRIKLRHTTVGRTSLDGDQPDAKTST